MKQGKEKGHDECIYTDCEEKRWMGNCYCAYHYALVYGEI